MLQFLICAAVIPMVLGLGFLQLKKERAEGSLTECYILGLLLLLFLGEAVSCIVIKLEESFSFYCMAFAGSIFIAAAVSLFAGRKILADLWKKYSERRGTKRIDRTKYINKETDAKEKRQSVRLWNVSAFCLLIVLPLIGLFLYVPDTGSSTMAETILTTVSTDTVFSYNPVTGTRLSYGMYPIYKFACLPLIYSAFYRLCGMAFTDFVFYAIPVWMFLLSAAVMSLFAERFFEGNKEKKRSFLLLLGVLLVCGDGMKHTLSYALLHSAFRGEVLTAAVIVPFGIVMFYSLLIRKERLYGVIGIFLSLTGILAARPLFLPESAAFVSGDGGREWMLLALSVFALYLSREKTKKKWRKQEGYLLGAALIFGMIDGGVLPMAGTAYAGACLYETAKERKKGLSFLAGMILLLALSGTVLPLRGDCVKKADVPAGDVEIQNRITELAERAEGEVRLAAPKEVMEQARLRNAGVILSYGKDLWRENCNREIADVYTDKERLLFEQMQIDYLQPDTAAAMAAELHCDILVMREEMSGEMQAQGGWMRAEGAEGYAVYYR